MSGDVTAVVLTTGEATTEASIASLGRQTEPLADIVVVRDVRPFHRAINFGASQVTTPYFVQVDSDMILDETCVAALYAEMGRTTGVVVGHLRDPLLGTIVGIKLFRTRSFRDVGLSDTISPDTQFIDDLAAAGWTTRYVGVREKGAWDTSNTLGEHQPDYSASYVYRKHLMEGQRYRHRRAIGGFKGHLARLEQSRHEMALVAQVGLARGFFRQRNVDLLGLNEGEDELLRLREFLADVRPAAELPAPPPDRAPLAQAFATWFRLGKATFDDADGPAFRSYMRLLDLDPVGPPGWPLKLALCQGLLAPAITDEAIAESFAIASPHIPGGRFGAATKATPLDNMLDYARSAGLDRFTLLPPDAGEFTLVGADAGFVRTPASVSSHLDADRRPRITAPFRLFGHVVCPDPERLEGVAWCLDLVKAGYTTAHIPTASGARKVNLPALLARQLFHRSIGKRLRLHVRPEPRGRALPDFAALAAPRQPAFDVVDKRVLMVTQSLGRGGSERQMVALIEGLVRRHYDVRVISLTRLADGEPGYEADLEALGVPVEHADETPPSTDAMSIGPDGSDRPAPLPPWLTLRMAPIVAAIRRHHPAVVHGWLDAAGIAGGFAGCTLGVPRTIIQQGSMAIVRRGNAASDAMQRAYLALSANPSITIVNNCIAGARDNETWIGLPRDKIGLIYNGFVPGSARQPAAAEVAALRNSLGLGHEVKVVGTVMRFVQEKDPDLWIDTAASVAAARADVRFLVFGFGPLEASMRSRVDRRGLRDRIILAGPTTDVGLAYSAMDVVLMTSRIEGLPNVMIEAQAVGRPVVAPDVGGTREALAERLTGSISAKRSRHQLARAVLGWLADEAGRKRVETAGPEFVAGRFGLDRMVEDTLRFYAVGD